MLKNYIKIAWKVLQRRKFFTFISLFGISLTLMVLMVLTAFVDHLVSPNYPEVNRDRSLYITFATMTTAKGDGSWSGGSGFHFLDKYVSTLKTPQKMALASLEPRVVDAFYKNNRQKLNLKTTDANFWEVMEFDFKAGKAFNQQQLEAGEKVAVINEKTRKGYFGNRTDVIGESIEISLEKYRIIGVVRGAPITRIFASADIYVPYTTSKTLMRDKNLIGGFGGVLLANSTADFPEIQAEFDAIVPKVVLPDAWENLDTAAEPYVQSFLRVFVSKRGTSVSYVYLFLGLFAFLFMALPAINLVNINVSRIMERSSEIGVRKAFGAASSTLVYQFIIENLIITLLGGLIGILLAIIAIYMLNNSGLIADLDLALNLKVLFISLMVCIFFGLMSGVLPAYRMSKMNVVTALKVGEG